MLAFSARIIYTVRKKPRRADAPWLFMLFYSNIAAFVDYVLSLF